MRWVRTPAPIRYLMMADRCRLVCAWLRHRRQECEWVSSDHDLRGYIYPICGSDGEYEVDDVQEKATAHVIGYPDGRLKP